MFQKKEKNYITWKSYNSPSIICIQNTINKNKIIFKKQYLTESLSKVSKIILGNNLNYYKQKSNWNKDYLN